MNITEILTKSYDCSKVPDPIEEHRRLGDVLGGTLLVELTGFEIVSAIQHHTQKRDRHQRAIDALTKILNEAAKPPTQVVGVSSAL